MGLWHLLSSPLDCDTYEDGSVVLGCGLKLSTRWDMGLLGGTGQDHLQPVFRLENQHELQRDIQMPANCAELWGAQDRPSCETRSAVTSVRDGHIARVMGHTEERCFSFGRFWKSLKCEPRQHICKEKVLGTIWVSQNFGWSMVSGNHQGGTNSMIQVDRDSDMLPTC